MKLKIEYLVNTNIFFPVVIHYPELKNVTLFLYSVIYDLNVNYNTD